MKTSWLWPLPFPAVFAIGIGCVGFVVTVVIDPDVFWHVRTGEWIVAHRALPATDPFLQTQTATPWVLHEWLFQILMVAPYRLWGLAGLRALGALAFVAVFASLYRAGRVHLSQAAATIAALAVTAVALSGSAARPQLASYCLFVPLLASLVRHYDTGRWQVLAWIPPCIALWTNLHGGYMIALGVLLVAALAALVDWTLVPRASGRQTERSPTPLIACFLMSVLAAAANPYGFAHLLYPFETMSIWLLPHIGEWQPPAWNTLHSRLVLALVLLFALFQQYRRSPPPAFDWAIVFALVSLALQSQRHAPFAVLAIGTFLVLRWHLRPAWLDSPAVVREHLRRLAGRGNVGAPSKTAKQLSKSTEGLLNLVLVALMLALTPGLSREGLARQRDARGAICGIDAIDYVKRHGIEGPGLNEYAFGGYMTYALWPAQKAFIDGRSDMYSDAFAKEYMTMVSGWPDWQEVFERYDFNYVVVSREWPIAQLLLGAGIFQRVYDDSKNVVLVRRSADAQGAASLDTEREHRQRVGQAGVGSTSLAVATGPGEDERSRVRRLR